MKTQKIYKKEMVLKTLYSYIKYLLILYRLFNILARFWDYIYKILAKTIDFFITIYLDNIFIYI